MDAKTFGAAIALTASLLQGCATTRRPLEIGLTDEGFSLDGQTFRTRAELAAAIKASGATECHLLPNATTAYRQVLTAVLALRDAECSPGIVGSVAP